MSIKSLMHDTAVLIFANSSQEEKRCKAIPKGEVLFDSLTDRVIQKVKQSKLTYFHISEKQQRGTSFGERFTNAVQSVFDNGYDKVIAIGNDTPHLQTTHIITAAEGLLHNNAIIGPAQDGGFYLLGIHRTAFVEEAFKKLPWQKSNLSQQMADFLTEINFSVQKLPVLRDIDALDDLKTLINFVNSIPNSFIRLFGLLLNSSCKIYNRVSSFYEDKTLVHPFNKGSPHLSVL